MRSLLTCAGVYSTDILLIEFPVQCSEIRKKKLSLQFTTRMVVCVITFEHFIQLFEEECPEIMHRAIITNRVHCMNTVIMVGLDDTGPVHLDNHQQDIIHKKTIRTTDINQLSTVHLYQMVCLGE